MLSESERQSLLAELSDDEANELLWDWGFWARPSQQVPAGDWLTWLLKAGRGFGKTRTGAEWIRWRVEQCGARRLALIGRTAADVRDVMIDGESGLLAISPPWFRPRWIPSKRRVTWPNGAMATVFTGEEPNTLRGPQHDSAWADELAAWRYDQDTWDNLLLGLRLSTASGNPPQVVATTTPRPTKMLRDLMADGDTVITEGSTYENIGNLAPSFIKQVVRKYEGTRLGQQELEGVLLDDVEGALWWWDLLEQSRLRSLEDVPELQRIVVGVDPGPRAKSKHSETGIIVAGLSRKGHVYVLEDASFRGSPQDWAEEVVACYEHWRADRVIAETNDGGDLVKHTIHTIKKDVAFKGIHARVGKRTRAEPVAALYEQGRVHHVGLFAALEDQMCTWVPGDADSPDRMDALVYAISELVFGSNWSGGSIKVESFEKSSEWRHGDG